MITVLNEVERSSLVNKTRKLSPARYSKRLNYKPLLVVNVDIKKLMDEDVLVMIVAIGKYNATIAYRGVLDHMKTELETQPEPKLVLRTVVRAIKSAIDDTDLKIDCTCPDFKYRFAYWATKFDYKYGKPEVRSPQETNPYDAQGAMCKHLTALLYDKSWLARIASIINDYMKSNLDTFRQIMGLDDDELYVSDQGLTKRTRQSLYSISPDNPYNSHNSEDDEEIVDIQNDIEDEPDEEIVVDVTDDGEIEDSSGNGEDDDQDS